MAAAAAICALVLSFAYKQLLFATFDPEVARVYGVPTAWMDTLLALVLATTIVVSMPVLGVTLIAAALIIPAVVARQLTDSFAHMTVLSTLISASCGALGLYLSYYLDAASGATVVLVASGLFVLSWLYADLRQRRGAGARRLARAPREGRVLD